MGTYNMEPNGDRPLLRGEINCRLAMFIAEFVLAYGVCPRLVIGGCIDAYKLIRHIDEAGTYRTDKFHHWTSRSRWCRVLLDGRVLQEEHP